MTTMKVKIAHQVPGRIRLKVPKAKDNPEMIEQIRQMFNVIPGVEEVTVNPVTGSVVVHYDTDLHHEFHGRLQHHTGGHTAPPSNEIDALASKIQQEAEYLAEHSLTARVVVDYCKDFDRGIKVATGNAVDLKVALAVGIAGITLLEVGATAATPVWVTLSVFALNHMIMSGGGEDDDRADEEEAFAPG